MRSWRSWGLCKTLSAVSISVSPQLLVNQEIKSLLRLKKGWEGSCLGGRKKFFL